MVFLVTLSVLASLPWYLVVVGPQSVWSWTQHVDEPVVIYDVVYTVLSSGVPAGWLACCGAHLLRAVLRSERAVRPSTTGVGQLLFQDELETAKTVILLVVVFVVCRCFHCVLVGLAAAMSATSDGPVLLDGVAALAVTVNGVVNPAIYAARNPHVARVLHLGRRQRYGGYVAEDTASTSATHASPTATDMTGANVVVVVGGGVRAMSDVDSDNNCVKMSCVVAADSRRQQNTVSLSVDFWATRRASGSLRAPSVIYDVTSRRRSSQSSDRTTSTLTSVVL